MKPAGPQLRFGPDRAGDVVHPGDMPDQRSPARNPSRMAGSLAVRSPYRPSCRKSLDTCARRQIRIVRKILDRDPFKIRAHPRQGIHRHGADKAAADAEFTVDSYFQQTPSPATTHSNNRPDAARSHSPRRRGRRCPPPKRRRAAASKPRDHAERADISEEGPTRERFAAGAGHFAATRLISPSIGEISGSQALQYAAHEPFGSPLPSHVVNVARSAHP